MTGLEKILEQIKSESDICSAEILSDARKQADEITAEAQKRAASEAEKISEKAEADCSLILSRAEAACNLDAGRRILLKKQEIISRCIEDARQSLISLPDDKYSELIIKMIDRFALPQSGEIMFCTCDAKRINAAARQAAAAAGLTVSDKTGNADGGFTLIYGGIEVNCTFSALFAENREKLQDKVHELLF